MCGIAGVIRFDGVPVDRQSLETACLNLRHRGPDDSGVWVAEGGSVGLTATRLAVLDPTLAGHQPMSRSGSRYHIVYNGEVYNFRELRSVLFGLGLSFETQSDTEVLLAACVQWGTEALSRLNGMWAMAFYDVQARSGFLARDRYGVKPLFYSADHRRLAFASELRPLSRMADLEQSIDRDALTEHLVFGFISGEKSILKAVRRLEPGSLLRFSDKGIDAPVRYYNPIRNGQDRYNSAHSKNGESSIHVGGLHLAEYDSMSPSERLRRLLRDAVVRRRVSDVPIGAFLSGGLDSSIMALHLASAMGRPVKSFSLGFADHRSYDESAFARRTAQFLGTEHHELILNQGDLVAAVPAILNHLGEPVGDSSIIPTALLSRFARESVTVALSGDGGDELFGGYWRYLAHETLRTYERIPQIFRRRLLEPLAGRVGASKRFPLFDRVRQFRKLLRGTVIDGTGGASRWEQAFARHIAWSRVLAPDAATTFLDKARVTASEQEMLNRARLLTDGMPQDDPINAILAFDLMHQLPADMLQKVDLASMMHSLEVRTPFLDPAVVEFAVSLPSEFKIKKGQRKQILVDAYRGVLPDEILDRPKRGFEVPIGELFRGPLRGLLHDVVTAQALERFQVLSWPGVQRVLEAHGQHREDHSGFLFALLSLCWWR